MPEKQRFKNHNGFSFLEVMLSVFILVVGIMAAITLMGKSIKESLDSRNQIVASLLAQEGAELVRNIRDNNWATGAVTFNNINNGTCRIDPVNNVVSGVNLPQCAGQSKVLKYNSGTFKYEHISGTNTKFLRQVIIANGATADEKSIISMVTWSGVSFPAVASCNTGNQCAYAQETLTKWGGN